jgi:repressor LexA
MKRLTARQSEVLEYIREHIREEGAPPTIMEIGRAMGIASPNGVRDHLKALERKGAIELVGGVARGIRLKGDPNPELPIVGRVAAGSPVLAEAHIEGHLQLGPAMFEPRADFLLRVQGMSMRDAGILDGDLLAVHRTVEVRNGQIVVARVDGEVTVKRLRMQGPVALLMPENPEYEPIRVDTRKTDLCIEGVVVGVIRREHI